MIAIPDYKILEEIYRGSTRVIFRGRKSDDPQTVIIKTWQTEFPSYQELARLRYEYELVANLNIPGVIKVHELIKFQNRLALIVDDQGGVSLKGVIFSLMNDLQAVLKIAVQLADSLDKLHKTGIIHKDINPTNIMVNPATWETTIIDFGLASSLPGEVPKIVSPGCLEGTLPYMSPEQTGRMNRLVDYRSDYYSLGISLYEMLTGSLPFKTTDLMELTHCHIARLPVAPCEVNAQIPQPVSAIIMKLLAKKAEDRYQSASAIAADCRKCLEQLLATGKIENFEPGQSDVSDKFQIPQKLYGREREVETLLTAFERVSRGVGEIMLVTGSSGMGKSSLVREVHKPIVHKGGYFISGKFDQLKIDIPYSSLIQALQELLRQILTESEERVVAWKESLLEALGQNGQVVVDVIPEVALIIGKQQPAPLLTPEENRNRFNLVFQKFIRLFCRRDHPLVIFLDDLQWVDSATLNLVKMIMTDAELKYILVIGAYRDNEVDGTHPLTPALHEMQDTGATINRIKLKPLNKAQITHLLGDTLRCNPNKTTPLAELCQLKTDGNPYFLNQFLHSLYEVKLFEFDYAGGVWSWDLNTIQKREMTNNVVDLMVGKIRQLAKKSQETLRLAACIGNTFDLKILAVVNGKSVTATTTDLRESLLAGLLLPESEAEFRFWQLQTIPETDRVQLAIPQFKFSHDRVQQASYSMIDETEKKQIHLTIGRLLLDNLDETTREEKLFEITGHLNQGLELITDEYEKIRLAELNLASAKKAKQATAYIGAHAYLVTGIQCLPPDMWEATYDLTFALHKELATIEYLNSNFDYSETLIKQILEKAKSNLEKAEIYNLLIIQYTMKAEYKAAIQAGREALRLLNIDLPEDNFQQALDNELAEAKAKLADRPIASLIEQPEMTAPDKKIAIRLLMNIDPPAYIFDTSLYPIIVAKMANLSLQYGPAPESAKGFSTYGIVCGSMLGDYRAGHEFGKLALQLSERFNKPAEKCKACLILANWLAPWVTSLEDSIALIDRGYEAGLHSGELQFAGYNLTYKMYTQFYLGYTIENITGEISDFLTFTGKTKNQWAIDGMQALQLTMESLTGTTTGTASSNGEVADENQFLERCREHNGLAWICAWHILQSQTCLLFGRFDEAIRHASEAEKLKPYIFGHFLTAEHNFYQSLALAAQCLTVSESEKKQYKKQIEANQQQMKKWADACPENFLHKYLLVEAESQRLANNVEAAIDLYDGAIQSAGKYGFVQNEAIANELAARFWLARNKANYAEIHIIQARHGYQSWGAIAKVNDLEKKYPELLAAVLPSTTGKPQSNEISSTTTITLNRGVLDLNTVIKASQAIAEEIVLDKLLRRLLKISMENSGAEKGILLLEEKKQLLVKAQGRIDGDKITVSQLTPTQSANIVSAAITNYVRRTAQYVVLADASNDNKFDTDLHIVKNRPKSVLCFPILRHEQLVGMLYLENNLITHAFTPERIEMLELLSSQIAASLENALLYDGLQRQNEERKQAAIEKAKLEEQLRHSQKMETIGTLAAGIAHDFNNILTPIIGYAEMCQRGISPESIISDHIRHILNAANRAKNLVLQILTFSCQGNQKREPVKINSIVKEVIKLLRATLPSTIEIKENIAANCGIVLADPTQIHQLLMNLATNAFHSMRETGGILNIQLASVEVDADLADQHTNLRVGTYVRLTVRDTGHGMNSSTMQRIFDPFFTTKSSTEGSGLGLSVTHGIVMSHDGEITVQSTSGKGTCFQIFLPRIKGDNKKQMPHTLQTIEGKERVLVIDDEIEIVCMAEEMLTILGYQVTIKLVATEAVTAFRAHPENFDIVITDLTMPEMTGAELTKELKKIRPDIPVILISGFGEEITHDDLEKIGISEYVMKPMTIRELGTAIRRALACEE